MGKTWQQKMEDKPNFPKILKLEKSLPCFNAAHSMGANIGDRIILVNPSEILPIMAGVRKGRLTTITEICKSIARKHRVKACCSLVTGILIMTIANAVEEMKREGKKNSTPWWRTLKADGSLNEKYPGGAPAQKALLEKEGFAILQKGKRYVVDQYERYVSTSGGLSCLPKERTRASVA
jgi:hypothetical protein